MEPFPLFAIQVAIYAVFPLALATLRAPLRTVALYVYLGILLALGGFLGSVYSLPITPTANISGGNLAYGAFLYTAVLLLIIQRNVSILRDVIWLVVLVNLFKLLIFDSVVFILESQQALNPYTTSPDVFTSSAYILLLGGGLIVLELLLLILLFERAKRHISNPAFLTVVYPLSFVAVLMLDGVLFPALALGYDPRLVGIVLGNVQGKLWLALAYSIPLLLFLVAFRARLQDYAGTPLSLRDLRFVPEENLLQEIAERRQQLAESEQRFRQVWEITSDAMALSDPEGIVLAANPAYFDLYGYTAEQVIGHSFALIFPAEEQESAVAQYKTIFASKSIPPPFESVIQRADGTERVVDSRSTFLTSAGRRTAMLSTIRDITARKRDEEALQEYEEFLSNLLENAPVSIYTTSVDGQLRLANRQWEKDTGKSRADAIGSSLDEIFPAEQAQAFLADNRAVIETGIPQTFEESVGPQQLLTVKFPLHDRLGKLTSVGGISLDISVRKQAEAALRASEERFRAWIENASDLITVIGEDGTIQYASPSYEAMLGYKPAELIGTSAFDLLHPDDFVQVESIFRSSIQEAESSATAEFRYRHKDGSWRMFEAIGNSYTDERGQMVGLINSRDITERKRAEEALEEQRNLLRTVIDNLPDAIYVKDRETRKILANRADLEYIGRPEAEVLGATVWDIYSPENAAVLDANDQSVLQGGQSLINQEERLVTPTGEERWMLTSKIPLRDSHGNITGMVGIGRDITQRKQMEDDLRDSRAQVAGIISSAMDAIISVDSSQRIILFNPAAEAMFGRAQADAIGQPLEDFLPQRFRASHARHIQHFSQTGVSSRAMGHLGTIYGLRSNGEEFPIEASISQTRTEKQELYTVILRDVTQRKQAEDTLRQRLTELEALHTVSAALRTAEKREQVLPILLNETLAALGLVSGTIWFYHTRQEELSADYSCGGATEISQTPVKAGEGIVGHVFASGQVYRSHEIRTDPLARPHIRAEVPPDWGGVYLPIRAGSLVTGVFFVAVPSARPLTQEQMRLLESLVEMSGAALYRLRLHEATVRRLAQMQALHAIDSAITSTRDLMQVLDLVLEQTIAQLEVDAACILLFDQTAQLFSYAAGRGFSTPDVQEGTIRLGRGFAGSALQEGRALFVDDAALLSNSPRLAKLWADEGFVAYHGIPLIARDRIIGHLEVFRRSPHRSDDEWRAFLDTLAGQAAIAVENATLFAETQRLLEEALAQAQLTQEIIDSAPEGMLVLDSQHRLVLANPAARSYLPILSEMSVGETLAKLGGQPLSTFLRSFANDQPWSEVTWGQPPRVYEVASQPLSAGQQAGGWVLVLRDVTVERERQRYQEMRERLATVGQLAAGIAHDFNNIMGSITLYTQLLRTGPNLSAKHEQYLAIIHGQSRHAADLIRQILDFSRSAPMEKTALDIAPLVKELIRLLERTLPENLYMELGYDRNQYVIYGDPTRLQQLLMNLAVNARDAMPLGGTLSFQLVALALTPGQTPPLPDMAPGKWLRLDVRDTGTGIDPEHLPHIFEPFFTTKEQGQGTGLGLAQVYGIVKQHDGSIGVESQPGQGTTFTVYLPLHSEPPSPIDSSATNEAALPGDGTTILLVEDNLALRMAVSDSLEGLGYRIYTAADGIEALEILDQQANTISLMLSDLVMPRMGGVELAQAARRRHPTLKIVMMTGHPLRESEVELRLAGIEGWVRKPFSIGELADQVRAVLGARP